MQLMDRLIPEEVRPISNLELSLQLGRMFHELGDPNGLMKRLQWAEEREGADFESKALIASFWLSFYKDTAKADNIMNEALGSSPTSQQYYTAGTQMYSAGAPEAAARYFKKSLELDPASGQAIGGLLQSYERAGDFASAARELDVWVEAHPTDQGARRRLESIRADFWRTRQFLAIRLILVNSLFFFYFLEA